MATARAHLPFLYPGQVQKEFSHNEALQIIDMLLQPVVLTVGQDQPGEQPIAGEMHLVGVSPVGVWAGHPQALAAFSEGGWRFAEPFEGFTVMHQETGLPLTYRSGTWLNGRLEASALRIEGKQVVGPRQPSIDAPVGGTSIDIAGRQTIEEILQALRQHGLIED